MLQAAVAPKDRALAAWERWKDRYLSSAHEQLETRFTPAIYRRFSDWSINNDTLPLLKQARQTTWLRNTTLFHSLVPTLQEFRDSGVEMALLKGSALAVLQLKDLGYRYMRDLDLYFPYQQLDTVLEILNRGSWELLDGTERTPFFYRHGFSYRGAEAAILDLHWHISFLRAEAAFDRELLEHSQSAEAEGIPFKVLATEANLFHVLTHGASEPTETYWILDAKTILEQAPGVDWRRVEYFARRANARRLLRRALHAISQLNPDLLDDSALRIAAGTEASLLDRLSSYRQKHEADGVLGGLPNRIESYVRCKRALDHRGSFLHYMQCHWELDSKTEALRLMLRNVFRGFRRLLRLAD